MKVLNQICVLVILTGGLLMPSVAQGNCRQAAAETDALLDQAHQVLTDGDPTQADTLVLQARAVLAEGCPNIDADVVEAATLEASITATMPSEPVTAGNFVITAPEVEAAESIFFARFVHAGIDSGPLDVYVRALGSTPIVAGISYGESTPLIALPAGSHAIVVRSAGSAPDAEALVTLRWDFVGNSTWSITASGLLSTLAFLVEPVLIIRTPLEGKARIRVVNWVAGAERLSVTGQSGTTYADGIGWIGVADSTVEPGTDTLQIIGVSGNEYGEPATLDFAPDTVYMLFLIGVKDGEPPVQFLTMETPQDQTRVRFINKRTDTVELYMRPGNALVTADLAPDTTSDWIVVPSVATTFIAYLPGAGPTGQEKSALSTQLRPGRDLTIVLRPSGAMEIRDRALTP